MTINLIDIGNISMLVERGVGIEHANVISSQWREKCTENDTLRQAVAELERRVQSDYLASELADLRAQITDMDLDRTHNARERDRLRAALTLIASFKGKTLIAPSFGPEYDKGHQAGAHAAFESAADIAQTVVTAGQGSEK